MIKEADKWNNNELLNALMKELIKDVKRMEQHLDMIRIKACEMNWDSIRRLAEEGLK